MCREEAATTRSGSELGLGLCVAAGLGACAWPSPPPGAREQVSAFPCGRGFTGAIAKEKQVRYCLGGAVDGGLKTNQNQLISA